LELEKINGASALFVGQHYNNEWSMRLTTRTVQRQVRQYVNQAGIKEKITPHSFRHGWAHKRRDNNAPLAFIQKGLGHVNPISTFVYEQYDDKEFMTNARQFLKVA
jgi:integrase/recombinase XerD